EISWARTAMTGSGNRVSIARTELTLKRRQRTPARSLYADFTARIVSPEPRCTTLDCLSGRRVELLVESQTLSRGRCSARIAAGCDRSRGTTCFGPGP